MQPFFCLANFTSLLHNYFTLCATIVTCLHVGFLPRHLRINCRRDGLLFVFKYVFHRDIFKCNQPD